MASAGSERVGKRGTDPSGVAPHSGRVVRLPLHALCSGDRVLESDASHYLVRVHRLRVGERFVVFDPDHGVEADAELLPAERPEGRGPTRVRVGELRAGAVRPVRATTVLQTLGKGAKTDAIVRDATELGASCFVPVLAERSVRRAALGQRHHERWQRIAVEAARQCGRSRAPRVEQTTELAAAVARYSPVSQGGIGLCLDPAASRRARSALDQLGRADPLVLLVGPEGGLTEAEMSLAAGHGFQRVTLGGFVLRTETVCAAVLGALLLLEG